MSRLVSTILLAWAAELASAALVGARFVRWLGSGRWLARLGPACLLGLVLLVTTGRGSAGDLLVAALTGLAIAPLVPASKEPPAVRGLAPRAVALIVFLLAWAGELVRGSLAVFPVLIGLRSAKHGGLVRIELDAESERGVTLSSLIATSTPGTVVVELRKETRCMIVHAIDARDADATRRSLKRFYHRYQRPVVP